jgi:protein-S-isoprenylcysteine O-methyltransferase Ste14
MASERGRRVTAAAGSLVFLVGVPGVVGGVIPWLLTDWRAADDVPGLLVLAGVSITVAGVATLLHAFGRFVVDGIGTPAPIAPTERLVVRGPYRHVRNPMYLAVAAVIAGQALILGRPVVVPYLLVFAATVAAFVKGYEEPTLARRFGEEYEDYRAAVPGWWPRLRAWVPGGPSAGRGG